MKTVVLHKDAPCPDCGQRLDAMMGCGGGQYFCKKCGMQKSKTLVNRLYDEAQPNSVTPSNAPSTPVEN